MKPEQELVILFLMLFVGVVATVIMLSVILGRLPKKQQHCCAVKHTHFCAMLNEFVGGQILIGPVGVWEKTGILEKMWLGEGDRIFFKCKWTATRKKEKWSPYMTKDVFGGRKSEYFNIFGGSPEFLCDIETVAIYQVSENRFCLILSNGNTVFLYHPKDKYLIKIEDVEGFEVMLPLKV